MSGSCKSRMLLIAHYVVPFEMLQELAHIDALMYFSEQTGQGYWAVVGWVILLTFFFRQG